ncbi:MAG TPA: hypothetical protein VJ123_05285 [Anaerolineales bacterium]|nr:hypothetical protein [Anaerolineales bacterium]
MKRPLFCTLTALFVASLACGAQPPATPFPTLEQTVFDSGRTVYGFFPSPPEPTFQGVLDHMQEIGRHADFLLVQQNIPWEEFLAGVEGESPKRTDIRNQIVLAEQNGLEAVFVVDPLNGLNRREFMSLPQGWQADFANPDVRATFRNFTLWVVRQFSPRYLGLASEINTYADAYPADLPNFLSLYREVYAQVKAESPETQVFVTFQWEDLNNLIPAAEEGRQPYDINWEQVEVFEPSLDLWVISSYPFVAFPGGEAIPADYYVPLLTRTDKPLAVAEGGYTSEPVGPFLGEPQDQVDYLRAIHDQIGGRLAFWVYLLLSDFDREAYAEAMRAQGLSESDANALGMFASVGLRQSDGAPKPAMQVWDEYRSADR